jgi:hypothetical protein
MAEILDNGASLDALHEGEYVVTNPDSGLLAAGTYFLRVTTQRTRVGVPLNQQIAYRIDDGEEFFRANLSAATSVWTDWVARANIDDLDGAQIAAKLDTYFGGAAWREPTDLAVANRDADSLDITSSTGIDATIPSASPTEAGLMSAADKSALDSLGSGGAERLVVSYPALEAVSGHRIVAVETDKVRHLDPTDIDDADRVLGLSLNAAAADDNVSVLTFGIADHAFGFTAGQAVFASTNGTLTQTPPTSGAFALRVGTALETGALLLHLEQPLVLAA